MAEDIESRLAAAAEQLREYEVTSQRGALMRRRMDELSAQLDSLRAEHAAEHEDVERLEGVSLTRVLTSLRGARDDRLARERAEADAALFRVREAEARLDAVRREYEAAQARLGQLAEAPATYAAVLDEQERWLAESSDPRGARLLALADERGRLTGELREIGEAVGAAGMAREALARVQDRLGSAENWSTYDTFFGGGMISSAVKQSRLDEAAAAAAHADRCLAALRTELADVGGVALTAPQLAMDGTTRFLDVWFDNIFTDLAVRDQIKQAQHNLARSAQLVDQVYGRLQQRATEARGRIDQLEVDRRSLLTG
jgi:hypothetical protein